MKYTTKQKAEYYKKLRQEWKDAKEKAKNGKEYEVMMSQAGLTGISPVSFIFTLMSMKKNGFEGLPYIDCKTFNKWKESGYKVTKGEHSKINGLVWIAEKETDPETGEEIESDNRTMYPKVYNLFHKSQVQPIV